MSRGKASHQTRPGAVRHNVRRAPLPYHLDKLTEETLEEKYNTAINELNLREKMDKPITVELVVELAPGMR